MKSFRSLQSDIQEKRLVRKKSTNHLSEEFVAGIPDAPTAAQLGMRAVGGFAYHPSVEKQLAKTQEQEDDEAEEVLFSKQPPKRYVDLSEG